MTEKKHKTPGRLTAHIISDLFSPLLAPTYGMAVAMWLTRLHYLPLGVRLWATLGVTFITAIIPVTAIALLIRAGKVSDTSISDPRQRTVPYLVSILCYIGAAVYINALKAPSWLVVFFVGAAVVSTLSMLINRKWKISAHTGGTGGLAAIIFWLALNGYIEYSPLAWVSAGFALVGIMAWSRLYLEHHTLMQVFAGATLAFAVEYGLIALLCPVL